MKYLLYIGALILMSSCATQSLKISKDRINWRDSKPTGTNIKHSIYLIGDVGGSKTGKTTIPLIELEKHLKVDNRPDEATDIVFLGDNIYPVGMPPEDHPDRLDAEHKLNVQLESVRAFKGNVTFVPGNHDWYTYGREGLRRQEKYIEDFLSKYNEGFTDYFRPSNGCGNVDVLNVADNISIVSIDSHWFLAKKADKYDYSDCDIQTRRQFVDAFRDTMENLKGRDVMLTMHHPMYTIGSHGGFYRFSSFFFPLAAYKSDLRLPLITSGLIVNLMRARISEQDTKSQPYVDYRLGIIPPVQKHGRTVVAAGHEHTLQHHVLQDVNYVVSGSGSKRGPVGKKPFTKFAYGNYGYALVDYYENGEVWMSFYANDETDENFVEVYRSKLL
jgi:hypothetical protein